MRREEWGVKREGLGCGSAGEPLPSTSEALGLVLSTT